MVTGPGARCLQDAEQQWQFDIFALADQLPHTCLSLMAFYLLKRTGLIAEFHLNEQKLCRFLHRVDISYLNCPYHNRWAKAFGHRRAGLSAAGARRGVCILLLSFVASHVICQSPLPLTWQKAKRIESSFQLFNFCLMLWQNVVCC